MICANVLGSFVSCSFSSAPTLSGYSSPRMLGYLCPLVRCCGRSIIIVLWSLLVGRFFTTSECVLSMLFYVMLSTVPSLCVGLSCSVRRAYPVLPSTFLPAGLFSMLLRCGPNAQMRAAGLLGQRHGVTTPRLGAAPPVAATAAQSLCDNCHMSGVFHPEQTHREETLIITIFQLRISITPNTFQQPCPVRRRYPCRYRLQVTRDHGQEKKGKDKPPFGC